MRRILIPLLLGALFYPLLMDLVMPYVGFYAGLPDVGLLGLFLLGFAASVVIAFLTIKIWGGDVQTDIRSVVKAWIPGAIGIVIGFPIAVLIGFGTYPSIMMTSPSYKAAKEICNSITVGMTYDEVKVKVGHLIITQPPVYFNKDGNGQIYLRDDVPNFETNCHIQFEQRKVKSSGMMYVWL